VHHFYRRFKPIPIGVGLSVPILGLALIAGLLDTTGSHILPAVAVEQGHQISHHEKAAATAAATATTSDASGDAIKSIAAQAHGRVGVCATIVENGKQIVFHGADHFPMQSVFKLPIAITALDQVDKGTLNLDRIVHVDERELAPGVISAKDKYPVDKRDLTVREVLRRMIEDSDNTACDVTLRLIGRTTAVQKYLHQLGIRGIVEVASEQQMRKSDRVQYRNWAQPRAMTELLCAVVKKKVLTDSSRSLLLGWMKNTTVCANRLKAGLPRTAEVFHKSGSSGTANGFTAATNDVGIVVMPNGNHMAVSVFVADSRGTETQREGTIAKIAECAYNRFK
jgi:beta-lactamase class A